MHAEMRRMPAERARHAKRLGHVQNGSGPAAIILAGNNQDAATTTPDPKEATTTTAKSTTPTSATAKQTGSSVPPASASTPALSASMSPSSTAKASTPSAASSTPAQSLPTGSSPSLQVPSPASTSVQVVSTTPSPSSSPQNDAAASSSSGLSSGAIAGIIALGVIVGVALIVFFVRKTYLRRREKKRISWTGAPGLGPGGMFDEPKPLPGVPEFSEKPTSLTGVGSQRGSPMSPFEAHGQSVYATPPPPTRMQSPYIPYATPAPPLASYNNPVQVTPSYAPHPGPPTFGPGNSAALAMARVAASTGSSSPVPSSRTQPQAQAEATVKCTFVPTLPDELSITTGERVRLVAQYDDGWALCANGRDEQGMVPQECLERIVVDQGEADWRNARRVSSLNPDGRRF